MKLFRCSLLTLSLPLLGGWFAAPGYAQVNFIVAPEAITVTGQQGATSLETRTLTIRATEPIDDLQIYPLDLYNRDGDRVFPQGLITAPEAVALVGGVDLVKIPITFNLRGAPTGEFQGMLLFRTADNEEEVPVLVRVKAAWCWPLALLILGVILGTTVSSYSRWGRSADEIAVRIETLRTQINQDAKLPAAFLSPITTSLTDAQLARENQQLDEAEQAIATARQTWSKWFRQRTDWIAAWEAGQALQSQLAAVFSEGDRPRYIQALQSLLQQTLVSIAQLDNAGELGQKINQASRQSARYLRVLAEYQTLLEKLDTLSLSQLNAADTARLQELQQQAETWKVRLAYLEPPELGDDTELKELEQTILEAVETAGELQTRTADVAAMPNLENFDLQEFKLQQQKSVDESLAKLDTIDTPSLTTLSEVPTFAANENPVLQGIAAFIPNPKQRLRLFSVAGYLTTIAFLAGTGFNQLYLENPTFGDDGLRDYFALLAWGFGAEATRSAVTHVLRRTDESKV